MRTRIRMALGGLAMAALAGCSGVAGDDYVGDPLLTLHGMVTSEQALQANDELRVALVWVYQGSDRHLKVSQETRVNPEFPSYFQLSIFKPPPEEVLEENYFSENDHGERRTTMGGIVAYLDGNHNGQLDFIPWEAQESEDVVLGSSNYSLRYLEGDPIIFPSPPLPETWVWWDAGFTLEWHGDLMYSARCRALRRPCAKRAETTDERFYCNDIWRACFDKAPDTPEEVLQGGSIPLDTHIEIALDAEPRLAGVMCHWDDDDYEFSERFDPVDPETWPEGAVQSCSDDGLTIRFGFAEKVSLCQSNIFPGDGKYPWPTEYPVPDWWPCEVAQE